MGAATGLWGLWSSALGRLLHRLELLPPYRHRWWYKKPAKHNLVCAVWISTVKVPGAIARDLS